MVGHSSGEIAAAYAIGALSTRAVMTVAYYRGSLSPKVKGMGFDGRMMAVGLSESEANAAISKLGDKVDKALVVACVNSPLSVTVSGDVSAIEELHDSLKAQNVFARFLQVDTAYHSHHMQVIAKEYRALLEEAQLTAIDSGRDVKMFSSVTEKSIDWSELGVDYWVSNLVSCVRFSGALKQLCLSGSQDGIPGRDVLLEVGPHALFKLPATEILQEAFGDVGQVQYLSTLIRNRPADTTAIEAIGSLLANNHPVDIHAVNFPIEPKQPLSVLTDLPQYPWNHTRSYWCESRLSRDYRFRKFSRSDILGAPVPDWNPLEPRFRNFLRLREQPWLRDHVVQGDVLFPACGYICMAIEACRQMSTIAPATFSPTASGGASEYRLREVSISRALVVPEADEGVETCFSMRCKSNSENGAENRWHDFTIFSYTAEGGWAENCRGLVSVFKSATEDEDVAKGCVADWEAARNDKSISMDPKDFYDGVDALGLSYGPLFQGLQDITVDQQIPDQATGIIAVTNTRAENPKEFEHDRLLHPATLDSFLQLALAALGGQNLNKLKGAMVPTFIEEMSVSTNIAAQTGDNLNIMVNAERHGAREARGNIFALDPITSKPVVLIDRFRFVAINSATEADDLDQWPKHCYKPVWEPDVELISSESLNRELQAAPKLDDRPKTVRELELLSYHFIDQALQEVEKDELSSMLPHHQKFYQNLCELRDAVVARTHPQQTDQWQQLQFPDVALRIQNMVDHYRDHDSAYDGKLLVRVGEALPAVFRQEVEPLALMTHENLLEDYYTTAVGMPNTYAQISRYVNLLSHKYPDLEYLEIGAGTGGATVPTLKGLSGYEDLHKYPRLKSYTYTDISSYFFQRAAKKLDDFSQFMNFKKLDVEQDPEAQDFKPASYDVIVAANVLHATSDMHRTMTHARKLLRPGGRLILLEMTNRLLAASVIFGTLPGWWNASEEWRTGGPLLTEGQWENLLQSTGFSSLQASSPDVLDPLEEGTRLMIVSAVEATPTISHGLYTPPKSHSVVLLCPESPVKMNSMEVPLALMGRLEKAGLQTQILPFSALDKQDIADTICISLMELEEPLLASPSPTDLTAIQSIVDASAGLLWVTRGAASSGVKRPDLAVFQGLARTLRAENESFPCITLDLDHEEKLSTKKVADLLFMLYERKLGSASKQEFLDSEFVEQQGVLHIKRAIEDESANQFLTTRTDANVLQPNLENLKQKNRPLKIILGSDLKGSFIFEDDPRISQKLQPNEVEVEVKATNLDAKGVQLISGELASSKHGQHCAGVVTRTGSTSTSFTVGDRVFAWCTNAFSTHIRVEAAFTHQIPDDMAFETAAAMAPAYTTAYYALSHIARLDAGETILIHEATSTTGQAAVRIASKLGAKIFATVQSEEERSLLLETYQLEENRVFSSQDMSFVAALRRVTRGRGIDVVLNTLSGEALQASFSCVSSFGRFVDLTKSGNARLEMAPFERGVSYTSADVDLLFEKKPRVASRVFQEAIKLAIDHGLQEDSTFVTKPWSQLSEAIVVVQEGKGVSSVVLTPTSGDLVLVGL